MSWIQENPKLAAAILVGFLCLSSLMGGLIKTLFTIMLARRIFLFAIPFFAGAGGIWLFLS